MSNLSEKYESCEESRMIYEGRILNLRVDSVSLPNGRSTTREVVEHEPAVVIIAENSDGELLLIKQFRYPIGEEIIELPAGIVEPDEDYETAAVRELREETGWKPGKVAKVAEVYPSPGFTDELFIIFYATELERSKLPCDEDEFITPSFVSASEVRNMIAEGAINDGKTLLGMYWWLFGRKNPGGANP